MSTLDTVVEFIADAPPNTELYVEMQTNGVILRAEVLQWHEKALITGAMKLELNPYKCELWDEENQIWLSMPNHKDFQQFLLIYMWDTAKVSRNGEQKLEITKGILLKKAKFTLLWGPY